MRRVVNHAIVTSAGPMTTIVISQRANVDVDRMWSVSSATNHGAGHFVMSLDWQIYEGEYANGIGVSKYLILVFFL